MKRHAFERKVVIVCVLGMVLCIILAACGLEPDSDGARFSWQSPELQIGMLPGPEAGFFTPEVFDVSGWHMVRGMADLGYGPLYRMADALASARVEGHTNAFHCIGMPREFFCNGQQEDFKLILATHLDAAPMCVWDTALTHEMAHFLLEQTTGDADSGHTKADVWALSAVRLGECP